MKKLRITVGDKSYDVTVEVLDDQAPQHAPPQSAAAASSAPISSVPSTPSPQPQQQAVPPGSITSPMAGVIKAIEVQPGSKVQAGQVLMLLEAMKLENRIAAPSAGTVKAVHVTVGDSVAEGQVLLELE